MKKFFVVLMVAIFLLGAVACQQVEKKPIRMSTTTSVNDSGLMAYLQPEFEKTTGYKLEITSAGTGAAIKKGETGDADILLVHSKSAEEAFIAQGFDEQRIPFMYNFFVIVGPADDPAGVKGSKTAADAFKAIAAKGAAFITRGDKSGTNNAELKIWKDAGLAPDPAKDTWYKNIGAGMGQALNSASEMKAYTLSDKATYLANKGSLEILLEDVPDMKNTYSMIAISTKRFKETNIAGADAFIKWMQSQQARDLVSKFGVEKYGQPLFFNLENK
ncbi:MAG: substrate-binding domain-containing protein [Anaerolineaceae bacterium]|nr:substrate-binding domain-containing protein [Anaerolineaceae bacterium]